MYIDQADALANYQRASVHESAHCGYFAGHGVTVFRVTVDSSGDGFTSYNDTGAHLGALREAYRRDPAQARSYLTHMLAGLWAGPLSVGEEITGPDANLVETYCQRWALLASRRQLPGMVALARWWAQWWVHRRLGGIYSLAQEIRAHQQLSGTALVQALASAFPSPTPRRVAAVGAAPVQPATDWRSGRGDLYAHQAGF
jgi:hypothetical protein